MNRAAIYNELKSQVENADDATTLHSISVEVEELRRRRLLTSHMYTKLSSSIATKLLEAGVYTYG